MGTSNQWLDREYKRRRADEKLGRKFWPEDGYNISEICGIGAGGKRGKKKKLKDDASTWGETEKINTPRKPPNKYGDGANKVKVEKAAQEDKGRQRN